jgi:hypothetical protein
VVTAKKSSNIPFLRLANNLGGMIGPIAKVPMSISAKRAHIYR